MVNINSCLMCTKFHNTVRHIVIAFGLVPSLRNPGSNLVFHMEGKNVNLPFSRSDLRLFMEMENPSKSLVLETSGFLTDKSPDLH